METFFALLALCRGNSPVTGEFPSQRPVTRSFDVFFALRMDKPFNKPSRRRWVETPFHSLWSHCYVNVCPQCHVRHINNWWHAAHMKLFRQVVRIHCEFLKEWVVWPLYHAVSFLLWVHRALSKRQIPAQPVSTFFLQMTTFPFQCVFNDWDGFFC